MLKKRLVVSQIFLLLFLQMGLINGMSDNESVNKYMVPHSIQDMPPEILNIIMLYLLPNESLDSVHSIYKLLQATKDFRSTDRYCNQTIADLIAQTCAISRIGLQSLHRAFRNKNISYPNGRLSYDFSNMEPEECLNLVKILYTLHLKKDSSDLISPDQFKNLISEALKDRQKEALKYLGLSGTYRQLSNTNDLGCLSIRIIDQELPNPDLNIQIEPLFSKPTGIIYHDFYGLSPLYWAIIFDKIEIIKLILDAMLFNRFHPVFAILNFASVFSNPGTFQFILTYCQMRYAPYYLEAYNNQDMFKDDKIWQSENNPLQQSFDAGNEENFIALVNHGANLDGLNLRFTKANANSELFKKFITDKQVITDSRTTLENKLANKEKISTKMLVNIIDQQSQKKLYAQKMLCTFGAVLLGLAAYQIFNKGQNYIQFARACMPKKTL